MDGQERASRVTASGAQLVESAGPLAGGSSVVATFTDGTIALYGGEPAAAWQIPLAAITGLTLSSRRTATELAGWVAGSHLHLRFDATILVGGTIDDLAELLGVAQPSSLRSRPKAHRRRWWVVTAIVVSGAGATAMCADLGARTIREEINAMTVIGVNPIQALVVPRVIAATFVALLLYSVVAVVGFVVFVQHVTPGAFVAGLTLLTGLPQVIVSLTKALLFGLSAGLIACYKGLSVGGGPTSVGNAVNETVVFSFMALFLINILATAFGVKVAP